MVDLSQSPRYIRLWVARRRGRTDLGLGLDGEMPMKHTLVAELLTATLSAGFVFYGTERVTGQRNVLSPEDELLAKVKRHPLAKLGAWLISRYEEYTEFAP